MTMAKDGLEFDVDNLEKLSDDEVEIIQFLRPNGKRRRMTTKLGVELAKKANGIILSCEELTTGQVAIYGRKIGQPIESEYMLLASNGPGDNSPDNVLTKVINHVFTT